MVMEDKKNWRGGIFKVLGYDLCLIYIDLYGSYLL